MASISTIIPDVSVVMSVYNNADTLAAAMDSILNQDGVDLEFIVMDDGSTDGSGAMLDEYARRDARVRVVHQENVGLTKALIKGCSLARAPWIARQDADDISLPGRLLAQLNRARQTDAPVLIGCGAEVFSPEGDVLIEVVPPEESGAARVRILDEGQAISPHGSIVFTRSAYEAVGGYHAEFYYAQDIDLNTRLAEYGAVAAVARILYRYKYSPTAISGQFSEGQRALYRIIRKGRHQRSAGANDAHLLAEAQSISRACRQKLAPHRSPFEPNYFMASCLRERQPHRAMFYYGKALACRPWSIKTVARWIEAWWNSKRHL